MKVQGIESRRVVVDITTEECMKGLAEYYNLTNVLFPPYQIYWECKYDSAGKLVRLVKMMNTSTHGSDCYEPSGDSIDDEFTLEVYSHLKALKTIFQRTERDDIQ